MSAAREATNDYSTGSRPSRGGFRGTASGSSRGRLALAGLAAAGIVLLLVSEFLPLFKVIVGTLETETRTEPGWSNHAFAMLLLGLAAVPMLLGALRAARPAMWALAAIGAVAFLIALTVDLPAAKESGTLRESVSYEDARAEPSTGFFVETLGGVLLLLSGGLLLLTAPPREQAERDAI
jgi:NADH:ubiquinone oxidoreductase subunit 6 (subunit J)